MLLVIGVGVILMANLGSGKDRYPPHGLAGGLMGKAG